MAKSVELKLRIAPALSSCVSDFQRATNRQSRNAAVIALIHAGLVQAMPGPVPDAAVPRTRPAAAKPGRRLIGYAGREP